MRRSMGPRQRLIEGDKGEPSPTRERVEAVRAALEEVGMCGFIRRGEAEGVTCNNVGWNCPSSWRRGDIGSTQQLPQQPANQIHREGEPAHGNSGP
jgi:hypothetical protein